MAELSPQLKEIGDQLIASVKTYVQNALDAKAAELQVRTDKATVALESQERRLSRHGEHLARLESRLKALETK